MAQTKTKDGTRKEAGGVMTVFNKSCKSDAASVQKLVGAALDALAPHIARTQIDSNRVRLALTEAASNALYHGNLDIEVNVFGGFDGFAAAAEEREADDTFHDRNVAIRAAVNGASVVVEVVDEGRGYEGGLVCDEGDILNESARGLWIIQQAADQVEWDDQGRIIRMVFGMTQH